MHVLCYGHHAGRPRVAAGPQRRCRGVRRVPARARDHRRARASLLRRRGAADRAPPAAPGAAVPDLGDAQRLTRQGAEPAGVRLHRDPRRHRDRGLRRPRRNRHRAHVHRDAASGHARGVPRPRPRRPGGRARRPGQRGEVDPRRDGAGDPGARHRRGRGAPRPDRGAEDRRARDERGRRPPRGRRRRPRTRGRARAAARLARGDGPRGRRAQAARAAPGGRAEPRRPLPSRPPDPRARAGRRGRRRSSR